MTNSLETQKLLSIYNLINLWSEKTPNAKALISTEDDSLTYFELFENIKRLVNQLEHFGIRNNDRIALVLPNGLDMATLFLAVSSFASCAPLNPSYQETEFDYYLNDLNAKAVITKHGFNKYIKSTANSHNIPILELTTNQESGSEMFNFSNLDNNNSNCSFSKPDDVALVLHTSGTTSRPKVVPLLNKNLCASANNIKNTLKLNPKDKCLNVMPLFHIHGLIGALLSSISAGGCVICTAGFNSKSILGWINKFNPSWYSAVPTMHQAVLNEVNTSNVISNNLRFIRSSSSALPPSVMSELEKIFDAPVVESYGMTEASHQMTSNPLPPNVRKPGSVGIAAGPEVGIMDDKGELLENNEVGEIVIRGDNVTPGYENNPEANEKSFTNGWFRTGDEGYFDEDNYLFISGRIKEIINRGGEKISPREIDEVILEHQAVTLAITFSVPHDSLGEDVVTAVVLKSDAEVTENEIRSFAFKSLADYKVPSQVIFVDEIPKGPTGKLQRIGLHKKLESFIKPEFLEPTDPVEKKLALIWSNLLKNEKIGSNDNFFRLGGDSLLAMQVVSHIRKDFNIEVELQYMFKEPTLKGQAVMILEKLVEEVEKLSDQEVKTLLDKS